MCSQPSSRPSTKAEEEIAIAQRTFYLKQAEIKAETDKAAAGADAAGPLAQAAREQDVLSEQEKVAERRAALTDRELDTKVRKPADAARYQAEQEAEARRIALVKQAEADAERARLTGEGEKAHRAALAEAVRIEGEAEADAIGAAEADAMHKKADAFARYGDAAVLQMLVEVLPSVVAKASEPLSAVDKMTVISTDGAGQLARTVADNVAQGVELLSSTTGVDLAELLKGMTAGKTAGAGAGATAAAPTPAPAANAGAGTGAVANSGASNGRIEVTD